jgi:protease I
MVFKMKILMITDNYAEDLELLYPYYRLQEAGYEVVLAGEKGGVTQKGKYGVPYETDVSWDDVVETDFVGLMIPGGWAPDKMRRFDQVKTLVKAFNDSGKPIGQICHAGWVTISAGILKGKQVTSTPGIKDDMSNAGAIWHNEPVVVDGNIVSSRWPKDLPAYMKAYLEVLEKSVGKA